MSDDKEELKQLREQAIKIAIAIANEEIVKIIMEDVSDHFFDAWPYYQEVDLNG